jgi:flavin-dependent dehydrogenase
MGSRPFRAAIVGAGPAGSALAIFLARLGAEVCLFDQGRRPPLLVGESLVPAVVPILQRLGFEETTASVGLLKPGVSFLWSAQDRASFRFARFAPTVPPYAYNIPRPEFDEALLDRAVATGVHHVVTRVRLERGPADGGELALAGETLEAAPMLRGRQPDLIVDATGRARLAARALDIPARLGPRDDVAHFAHWKGFEWDDEPGQVVISRMPGGWSWRIPLQDRLSVGIVVDRKVAATLGRTPEERLEQAAAIDPWLSPALSAASRVSPVATYSNYQLVSERGFGPGWVMIGDAFGFVDPMLSPGVFLALRSAELVADVLAPFAQGRVRASPAALAAALQPYAAVQAAMVEAWMELVAYLYDGRLMAMLRAGHDWMQAHPGRVTSAVQNHIERQVALQASGVATTSGYSRRLLRLLGRYGLRGVDPAELAL